MPPSPLSAGEPAEIAFVRELVNTVELEPDGDGTLVRWHADVNLSGVIAMVVGDRIGPMVERINQSVLACVEREVATG